MQQNYEIVLKKFKNILMKCGESAKSDKILLLALTQLKEINFKNPFYILQKAVYNVTPVMFFNPKRRGAKIYKLPAPIKDAKAMFLSIKWILESTKSRSEYGFNNKLSAELLDASNGVGLSIKKKEDLYKIIIENRPFLKVPYKRLTKTQRKREQRKDRQLMFAPVVIPEDRSDSIDNNKK